MQSIIDTISNAYDGVIFFFKDIFTSIKSFFVALFDTVGNYYDAVITYAKNVFLSLKYYLFDLPLLILEKAFSALTWLFNWAADSCSYCLSGVGSLASSMQSAFNTISSSSVGSSIMYCLQRAEVVNCFRILTCGLILWSIFKVISFIKSLL